MAITYITIFKKCGDKISLGGLESLYQESSLEFPLPKNNTQEIRNQKIDCNSFKKYHRTRFKINNMHKKIRRSTLEHKL